MSGRVERPWTTPEDIAARVRRGWDDGSLLRDYAAGVPFARIEVVLHGPSAAQVGDDLEAARAWVGRLDTGRRDDARYTLEWAAIGGRRIGRNQIPVRAVVSDFTQAWSLLGTTRDVRLFDDVLAVARAHPAVHDWACRQPRRALELATELPRLLAAHRWLDAHRGSDRYLREITAPGVDTKFAERHRTTLAAMLGVPATASGFLTGLGLRGRPELVRLRVAPSLGLPHPLTELAARAEELIELDLRPSRALVVENEITYLSVDVPSDGVVLWGKGFEVDRAGRLPWLRDVEVTYWGDLDSHGFAILDRLRAWLPQTRSVLMDRETLMAHRERWVVEDRPTAANLTHLGRPEAALYADLVTDALGERVRLEQERIDWAWAQQRLSSVDATRAPGPSVQVAGRSAGASSTRTMQDEGGVR